MEETSSYQTGEYGSLVSRLDGGIREERTRYNITPSARRKRMAEIFGILRRQHALSGEMTPTKLRSILEELGPTFVKMGQILSMRSEILPQRYCDELTHLRAEVDPLPFDQVRDELGKMYGRPLEEIFESIDPSPLGSASLAQVHRARLVDGSDVAVKVRRPNVQETMARDIDIMRVLLRRLRRVVKSSQVIDLDAVVEEVWLSFREETDFTMEARNLREFHEHNLGCEFVDCPQPRTELCGEGVVVMDFVEGIGIADRSALEAAGYDVKAIGEKLVDNYATQVLDDGFFHADPHPGNILISNGKIMYLDLGMVGRLSAFSRSCMSDIIKAVGESDSDGLKRALIRFAVSKDVRTMDHAGFLAELDVIIDEFGNVSLQELDLGALMFSLIGLARRQQVEMPSAITMMARGLMTLEGVLDKSLPETNMIEIIRAHIEQQQGVGKVAMDEMRALAVESRAAVHGQLRASAELGELVHMLTRGQLKMNMEMLGSREPVARMGRMVDHLTLAIVIAGLFIGSSIVYYAGIKPVIFGVPVLGFLGYAGAAVLSVWLLVDILRGRRM